MSELYCIDRDQFAVLKRIEKRLYDEMTRLGADERRDLANALNGVLHSVEQADISEDRLVRERDTLKALLREVAASQRLSSLQHEYLDVQMPTRVWKAIQTALLEESR